VYLFVIQGTEDLATRTFLLLLPGVPLPSVILITLNPNQGPAP